MHCDLSSLAMNKLLTIFLEKLLQVFSVRCTCVKPVPLAPTSNHPFFHPCQDLLLLLPLQGAFENVLKLTLR